MAEQTPQPTAHWPEPAAAKPEPATASAKQAAMAQAARTQNPRDLARYLELRRQSQK